MRLFEGSAEHVRERFAEVRERVAAAARAAGRDAAEVEILVATKYVDAEHLGVLRDAGIRLIGENRAQDLVAKHARYGDAFDYHFIGHLQSRKTRLVLPVGQPHPLGRQPERRAGDRGRAENPPTSCSRSTSAARSPSRASRRARSTRFLDSGERLAQGALSRAHVHAAAVRRPAGSAALLRADARPGARLSARMGGTYTFDQLSMGTSADYEVAVQEGATVVRVGSVLF